MAGKELVKVENLVGGDDLSVANIKSIRDELNRLHATPIITGELTSTEITTCILKPTPIDLAVFPLDKGDYLINGHIAFKGDEVSKGEAWIEWNGTVHEKSKIVFGSSKYGVFPFTALVKITADNTTLSIRAKRTHGLKLNVVSNDKTSSYLNWFKIN